MKVSHSSESSESSIFQIVKNLYDMLKIILTFVVEVTMAAGLGQAL